MIIRGHLFLPGCGPVLRIIPIAAERPTTLSPGAIADSFQRRVIHAARPMPPLSSAVRTAALAVRVDRVTAEVVTAMREAGIRSLLKGPSIATWLYGDGGARPYDDSDLLVAPGAYRHAAPSFGTSIFALSEAARGSRGGPPSRREADSRDVLRSGPGARALVRFLRPNRDQHLVIGIPCLQFLFPQLLRKPNLGGRRWRPGRCRTPPRGCSRRGMPPRTKAGQKGL